MIPVLDLYAGCGGVAEGLRSLGLTEVGLELDRWACATRAAAGHPTIQADVATYPLDRFAGQVDGLWASPPCTTFSSAGNGEGRKVLDRIVGAVHAGTWHSVDPDRTGGYGHVLEVGRWVEAVRPQWVACEQVPPVLPVWQAYAERWRRQGWSTWAGVLCAADYGLGQERDRAILLASRVDRVAPPAPTHTRPGHTATMFGELAPWVTMAEALEWPEPANSAPLHLWPFHKPATTVAGDPRIAARCHHDEGSQGRDAKTTAQVRAGDYLGTEPIKLTEAEATTLQGFRSDYPFQGPKAVRHVEVGNAVPPVLAMHVAAAASGRALEAAA